MSDYIFFTKLSPKTISTKIKTLKTFSFLERSKKKGKLFDEEKKSQRSLYIINQTMCGSANGFQEFLFPLVQLGRDVPSKETAITPPKDKNGS